MKEQVNLIILYDYYGELLSKRQQECFYQYYFLNYSLAEIADLLKISRTAISNQLKESEKKLYYYESILHLYEKEERFKKKIALIPDETLKNTILGFYEHLEDE